VKQEGNQLLDYLNALASNQIDLKSVTEKSTLLEFSGAHGLLRPKAVKGR
jgi:F420-non-reducing hydrogenase small subunit